jgi:multiple sugar transport system substrate-binding protein
MRRTRGVLAAAFVVALVSAACTAGGGNDAPTTVDPSASHEPVEIKIWGAWTGRELKQFNAIFDEFTAEYPWITVKSVGGIGDQKIIQAINSGTAPDVVLSFGLDEVGKFCESGAWQDLSPFMEQTNFDNSVFPEAIAKYTSYAGSQCALPFLTDAYGLYYNVDMFDQAGLTEPPRTYSELLEYAKKLTVFNDDGSIKIAGIVPWEGYYETNSVTQSIPYGCTWYTADGSQSNFGHECWKSLFEFNKELVDFYGAGNLQEFVAGQASEWGAKQDFMTGRVAMNIDGEWRTTFIEEFNPDLNYDTAPMPVRDDLADDYGMGQVGGTIIGIPRGSEHPSEAWLLVSWMATDTDTLVYMANFVGNVPTTFEALESPDLDLPPQFQTFLDMFAHPLSHYKETSAIGSADQDAIAAVMSDWQAGKIAPADLQSELDKAAQEVNDLLEEASL